MLWKPPSGWTPPSQDGKYEVFLSKWYALIDEIK
jgi:hypothetical protein